MGYLACEVVALDGEQHEGLMRVDHFGYLV